MRMPSAAQKERGNDSPAPPEFGHTLVRVAEYSGADGGQPRAAISARYGAAWRRGGVGAAAPAFFWKAFVDTFLKANGITCTSP